jgi:hypothetical protein
MRRHVIACALRYRDPCPWQWCKPSSWLIRSRRQGVGGPPGVRDPAQPCLCKSGPGTRPRPLQFLLGGQRLRAGGRPQSSFSATPQAGRPIGRKYVAGGELRRHCASHIVADPIQGNLDDSGGRDLVVLLARLRSANRAVLCQSAAGFAERLVAVWLL